VVKAIRPKEMPKAGSTPINCMNLPIPVAYTKFGDLVSSSLSLVRIITVERAITATTPSISMAP
jgi:hypothetical protein